MSVADTILTQLGGQRFIAMTGSSHFLSDGNTLKMNLARNKSQANRLSITLDEATDTYTMRFYRMSGGKLNRKTFAFSPVVEKEISTHDGVYFDQLDEIFESVTGLYTSL